jgi:hypothetical protein
VQKKIKNKEEPNVERIYFKKLKHLKIREFSSFKETRSSLLYLKERVSGPCIQYQYKQMHKIISLM